ncbi:MAG: response regulator [Anaerolineae bacterium]
MSSEKIKVLITDDIAETRENLRKLLSFDADIEVVGAAASGAESIALAKEHQPHVCLMDINMPDMDGITATEEILKAVPTTQVVMLSVQSEADYLRRAMLAGARDFLTKPPSGDELMSTIRRVYEMGKRQAALRPEPTVPTVDPDDGRGGPQRAGEVVAVFSPKGGVGCTTIVVNLAVALQRKITGGPKIGVMDTSVQFGDVGVMLNLQTHRSMSDLVPHLAELDNDILNSVLASHGSGIKVLLAPPHPEEAETLLNSPMPEGSASTSALGALLELMRNEFDIVVVDMWSWVDDVALTVLDAASLIVLVVMPNIPSIKSARLFLEVTDRLGYPMDKIALVVNGVDRRMGIRVEQIEQAMIPVIAQIPLDEQVVQASANHGVPFVMRDENLPISQGILQLAEYVRSTLIEEPEAEIDVGERVGTEPSRRRFGRVLG